MLCHLALLWVPLAFALPMDRGVGLYNPTRLSRDFESYKKNVENEPIGTSAPHPKLRRVKSQLQPAYVAGMSLPTIQEENVHIRTSGPKSPERAKVFDPDGESRPPKSFSETGFEEYDHDKTWGPKSNPLFNPITMKAEEPPSVRVEEVSGSESDSSTAPDHTSVMTKGIQVPSKHAFHMILPILALMLKVMFVLMWPCICLMALAVNKFGKHVVSQESLRGSHFWNPFKNYADSKLVVDRSWSKGKKDRAHQSYMLALNAQRASYKDAIKLLVSDEIKEKLPGIMLYMDASTKNSWMPVLWDIMRMSGFILKTEEEKQEILNQKGVGVCVAVGDHHERDSGNLPVSADQLTYKEREMIDLAIKKGLDVVPSFSTGHDTYDHMGMHPIRYEIKAAQNLIASFINMITETILHLSLLKLNKFPTDQQRTELGAPIPVTQNENPSNEEVDHIGMMYLQSLRDHASLTGQPPSPEGHPNP